MVWVGIITLFPFDFGTSRGRGFFETPLSRQLDDIPLNILLFVPLGAWLNKEARSRSLQLQSILFLGCVAGSLGSWSLEYLQTFLPSRFPSVVDIVSNTSGTLCGVYLHRRWSERAAVGVAWLRNSVRGVYVVVAMAAFTVLALLVSAALQAQTRLSNWDASYPLVVGNERTGNRPWRGRVYTIEMTDAATPQGALQRFAEGKPTVIPGTRIASYDLSGDAPYRDDSGHLPSLTWAHTSPVNGTHGARKATDVWLSTEGPADAVGRRVRESNAFSLRVRCASDDLSQGGGPPRIVSNSMDSERGNLVLGQDSRQLGFRFRTQQTGEIPFPPDFVIPAVFSDNGLRDILVTYDGATVRAAVAKSGRVHRFELTPGSSLVAAMGSDVRPDELQLYKLAYIACLFVLPGTLVHVLCRSWRNRLAWTGFWVFGFTLAFEVTLGQISGKPFVLSGAATTAVVGSLVFLATLVMPAPLTQPVHIRG